MAVSLQFIIDGIDRGQPLNAEDFSIQINEDDTIGARIVSFENELTFGGDVYSYLVNKLATSGYCELVRVNVQYLCNSGTWQKLVDGYIIVTECTFILDRCQVKTKLYDETFSTKINNNKAIPFSLSLTQSKNGVTITPPTLRRLEVFNPATGIFEVSCAYGYPVYDVFKHLVDCMSDGLIDFQSNYFAYTNPGANVVGYTIGEVIRVRQIIEMQANFETLYVALKKKLNLGLGFEKQANGRPLLRIEPITYFYEASASVNLNDQPQIEMKFDTARLYQAAQFGANTFLEKGECDNGNGTCSFTQLPFRGFRSETFGFIGECNTSNILDLETNNVVFDNNAIEDIIRFNNTSFDDTPIIINCNYYDFNSNPNCLVADAGDPFNLGQTIYNTRFTNDKVSANWLNGYPNSLYSFFEGFNPFTTQLQARKTSAVSTFDTTGTATTFSGFNGFFIPFPQIIVQGSNVIYDNTTYTVPFTGIYTVSARLVRAPGIGLPNPITQFAIIEHQDSTGTPIQTHAGPSLTASYLSAATSTVARTFLAEQGDKIVIDMSAVRVGAGTTVTITIVNNISGSRSEFNVIGFPIAPPELEAINIDEVRAYLYKFNRPLTMAEINAITSETSKPILLGREADPLAVIPTYIKTISIQSVMRKNADFELKSNKLLQ